MLLFISHARLYENSSVNDQEAGVSTYALLC